MKDRHRFAERARKNTGFIVGLSIAMNAKDEELKRIADHVVTDFTAIPRIITSSA
jgi:hypothetical protein